MGVLDSMSLIKMDGPSSVEHPSLIDFKDLTHQNSALKKLGFNFSADNFWFALYLSFADAAETIALSTDLAAFVRMLRPGEDIYFVACFADVRSMKNQKEFAEQMHQQIDQLEELSKIFFPDDDLVGFAKPNEVYQLYFAGQRLNVIGLFDHADNVGLISKRPTLIFSVC